MVKKPRVLICDDEEGVRESLRLILSQECELIFATNGEEALERVKSSEPDLAILDIKMPKVNGLEALQRIKQIRPDLSVIVISGYESADVASSAARLGADEYLTKPFDREKVLATVRRILSLPKG